MTAHAGGRPFDLTVRYPRPVYLDPDLRRSLKFDPDRADGRPRLLERRRARSARWNGRSPATRRPTARTPTISRRRRSGGPFTVGVALETEATRPLADDGGRQAGQGERVAAIGHGGVFIGKELTPSQEELLLDSCNWLLGRDDRLARPATEWRYPRVEMSDYDQTLWLWVARLGLPMVFAYLGTVVLLLRRLR